MTKEEIIRAIEKQQALGLSDIENVFNIIRYIEKNMFNRTIDQIILMMDNSIGDLRQRILD